MQTELNIGAGSATVRIEEVGLDSLSIIKDLNTAIFGEERIINSLERDDLMLLVAWVGDEPAGFKVGYRENRFSFYSAKGGVLHEYRGFGIARLLLDEMVTLARERGFRRLAYDTFPNMHPGMTVMGLAEGFRVVKADFNTVYRDFRLRFEKAI
ncbi:MAG: GNAT family N-acetyltransferase [Rhodothermales bacterium]